MDSAIIEGYAFDSANQPRRRQATLNTPSYYADMGEDGHTESYELSDLMSGVTGGLGISNPHELYTGPVENDVSSAWEVFLKEYKGILVVAAVLLVALLAFFLWRGL